MRISRRLAGAAAALWLSAGVAGAVDVTAAVLRVDYPTLAPISRYDARPDDLGFAGAGLATEDNATTGSFLGHDFTLVTRAVPPEEAGAALDALLARGIAHVAVIARAPELLALSEAAGDRALIYNAGARDTGLRDGECRANVLHVTPSEAMLADAAVQFAVWKRWSRLALVEGSNPADTAMGDAYRRAAARFGARLADPLIFEDTGGARRTDTGHVLVQRQLPVFTEALPNHDAVIAADASGVFAPYLPYHLWTPRPVLGAAGLRPVSFHAAHEAWGATQFQRRFEALARRPMQEADYDAWLALRVLGEAVTRTGSADAATVRDFVLSDAFELAAFKGVPVTFRPWNGQLRAPVLLYDGRITVSVSPQEGFLHQVSPLDTLGLDRPDSACAAFD